MTENKKFKLTSENLDLLHLIQQIVYINWETYQYMKNKDLNDVNIQDEFDLICDSYLRLHSSYKMMNNWTGLFDSSTNKEYLIIKNDYENYILRIDLEKSLCDCCKLGMRFVNRIVEPVLINIFNIEFVSD